MRKSQLSFFKASNKSYGGELLKTRRGRASGRVLDTKNSMHLVLRSSKARGSWSFLRPENAVRIRGILAKFSGRYGVRILSLANVGNHLHLQIQLTRRASYRPFIRAVTGAIAMAITGVNRWTQNPGEKLKFWDLRPFTRVLQGYRSVLNLRDYLAINRLEGMGIPRLRAESLVRSRRIPVSSA